MDLTKLFTKQELDQKYHKFCYGTSTLKEILQSPNIQKASQQWTKFNNNPEELKTMILSYLDQYK